MRPSTVGSDPEELRRLADDIVARPEFRQEPPSLLDRLLDWLGDLLNETVGAAVGSGGGYLIGYAIIAAAIVALGYFVWKVFPRRGLGSRPERPTVDVDTVTRRSRDEWLAEAAAAEAAGDYDGAVHARYHALTTGLADVEVLPSEPSTTSGEHREAFAESNVADPGRRGLFDRATNRYEEVWFGGSPAERDDSEQLAVDDRALLVKDEL